jgi:hypothetical protein
MINFQCWKRRRKHAASQIVHERIISHGGLRDVFDLSLLPRAGLWAKSIKGRPHAGATGPMAGLLADRSTGRTGKPETVRKKLSWPFRFVDI